VTAIYEA